MTTTIEEILANPIVVEKEEEKTEENNLRHIINPPNNLHIWKPGMEVQDIVDIARVRGLKVRALCGLEFVPTKDPLTVEHTCDACLDIASKIMDGTL